VKICIYGAGAIGAHIGVLLKRAGVDVSAHLEVIKANGLRLIHFGEDKTVKVPASNNPADLGVQDYVIVALKSHQAWEAAEQFKPLLGPDTAVVTAQNGIPWWYFHGFEGQYANLQLQSVDPDGRQWKAIGPERAIGCTVYPAAEIIAPGVVKHIYGDRYGFGEPTRKITPRVTALAQAFEAAGLKSKVYPEIRNDRGGLTKLNRALSRISA
jgi:2-dehydropantoate 2-reductase